jgi:hypothetical protein
MRGVGGNGLRRWAKNYSVKYGRREEERHRNEERLSEGPVSNGWLARLARFLFFQLFHGWFYFELAIAILLAILILPLSLHLLEPRAIDSYHSYRAIELSSYLPMPSGKHYCTTRSVSVPTKDRRRSVKKSLDHQFLHTNPYCT